MRICATSWSRVGPCLAVLGVVTATTLAVIVPAWTLGKRCEDERQFLRSYRIPYDSEAYIATCAEYATASTERNEVVFLGDSTCMVGVRTRQLEQASGLAAYNLGTYGMIGIQGFEVLAQQYLKHHPAPRGMVLCVRYGELAVTGLSDRRSSAARSRTITDRFLWCYGEVGAYPRPSHLDPFRCFVSQGVLVALGEVLGGMRHSLDTPAWSLGGRSFYEFRDAINANRGFVSVGQKGIGVPADAPDLVSAAANSFLTTPMVSEQFDLGVRSLAERLAAAGSLLLVQLTPEPTPCSAEHWAQINDWFDRLELDCPNVVCGRPPFSIYDRECFYDAHHCNDLGARRFTAELAERIAALLKQQAVAPQSVVPDNSAANHHVFGN